jgi:hypothetical protein
MAQRRVRRPTLTEEEQRRTIGLDGPDLRVEPADLNLTGSVGDRDDAVAGCRNSRRLQPEPFENRPRHDSCEGEGLRLIARRVALLAAKSVVPASTLWQ